MWSQLINEEFKVQYIDERTNNYPVTEHFKILLDESLFHANETNILSLVVLPIYKSIYKLERNFCKGTTRLRKDKKLKEICSSADGMFLFSFLVSNGIFFL